MNDIDLAQSLFKKPAEVVKEAFGGRLPTYTVEAEAMADSVGGFVQVQFMGDTVNLTDGDPDGAGDVTDEAAESGEAAQWVEVPCSACIKAGDRVLVTIQDGAPIDCTAIGFGDALGAVADAAATLAQQADTLAQATKQNFWYDANGAHVSTTANDAEGERNILMNAYGILLRAYANYLAALTSSGVAFYDGTGNAASNIVAAFGSSGAQIGASSGTHMVIDNDSVDVLDGNGQVLYTMDAGGNTAEIFTALQYFLLGMQSGNDYAFFRADKLATDSTAGTFVSRTYNGDINAASAEAYVEDGANALAVLLAGYGNSTAQVQARANGTSGFIEMVCDKATMNGAAPIVYEDKTVTVSSTAAGANYSSSAISVLKTGYSPIGCYQTWWASGTNQNKFNDYGTHVEAGNLYVRLHNYGTAAASGSLKCRILYVKLELL